MKWSPSVLAKLGSVRDMRERQAEMSLTRVDRELQELRAAEAHARDRMSGVTQEVAVLTTEANENLRTGQASGRRGISEWKDARKRGQHRIVAARTTMDDSVSDRLGKELELERARAQWRDKRFDVERLRALVEQLKGDAR